MIYTTTSVKEVIARIIRNTGKSLSSEYIEDMLEWIPEGIKKLRRYEGTTINAMVADCNDSLDDFKNKWYTKLIEKRDKKKKVVIVILVLVTAMMIGLAIAA